MGLISRSTLVVQCSTTELLLNVDLCVQSSLNSTGLLRMCMSVSAITHSEGTVQFPHEAHKLYAQLTEQITIWGTTV